MEVDTTIPAPDFSRDRGCPESDSVHWWSKFLGETGLGLVLGGKVGKTVPKGGPTPPPLPGTTVAAGVAKAATNEAKVAEAGQAARKFLGDNAVIKRDTAKSLVMQSEDKMRQIRLDLQGHGNPPHAHIQVYDPTVSRFIDAPDLPHQVPFLP